jgi:hypothetical protein
VLFFGGIIFLIFAFSHLRHHRHVLSLDEDDVASFGGSWVSPSCSVCSFFFRILLPVAILTALLITAWIVWLWWGFGGRVHSDGTEGCTTILSVTVVICFCFWPSYFLDSIFSSSEAR